MNLKGLCSDFLYPKESITIYVLYCLLKNRVPIYIGVTTIKRLKQRAKEHKLSKKDFDRVIIIKEYDTREKAQTAENSIIRFHSLFDIGLINSKVEIDVINRVTTFIKIKE